MHQRLEFLRRLHREVVSGAQDTPVPVTHVLEAYASAGTGLWGKERLVQGLMLAQRASGDLDPSLIVFVPCRLADDMRELGFSVTTLEDRHRRLPIRSLPAFARALRARAPAYVHSHGYKANLVARLARLGGARMRGLVATCHGWSADRTMATGIYNELDRQSAFVSDVTTVTDERMLRRFPKRGRLAYVANGIADRASPTPHERAAARARFGFPPDRVVFGFLGRTTAAKGLPEFLECARRCSAEPYLWAIAGTGDLDRTIADARLPNVRFLGYVADGDAYHAALDVYVQASHFEGLSLALLEAMRAGLPIVASDAGSTALALRDGVDGTIVAPGDVDAMVTAARAFGSDTDRARTFGIAARARFVDAFRSERQHRAFLDLYRSCDRAS
ncbi:MAG: hypothetical protein NVSMB19_23030 [Vulcanimicrobiaceae bacterium]